MKLLISVTSAEEARAAIEGGADIIDVKNPADGAMGTASVTALRDVCAVLPTDREGSAALGEPNSATGILALAAYGSATFDLNYVKLALGSISPEDAITLLHIVQANLHLANPDCALIAVGYADAAEVGTLSWRLLPEVARAAHIAGCMIDTAQKDGRRLLDHCQETDLESWIAECGQSNLLCALAGSLQLDDLPVLRRLGPDVVGFRGAACRGDRVTGQVDVERVTALRAGLFD